MYYDKWHKFLQKQKDINVFIIYWQKLTFSLAKSVLRRADLQSSATPPFREYNFYKNNISCSWCHDLESLNEVFLHIITGIINVVDFKTLG